MAQRLRNSKTEKAGQPSPSSEKLQTDWKALKQDHHAKMRQARLNKMMLESVQSGKTKMVERLLNLGADVNAEDHNYTAALIWAARCGHADICKILIENGAGIEATDLSHQTPLMHAAHFGQKDACVLLIEKGANINAKDNSGYTALMWAAYNGQTDTCIFLIGKGANINEKSKDKKTALMYALSRSNGTSLFLEHIENLQSLIGKANFRPFFSSFHACFGTGV